MKGFEENILVENRPRFYNSVFPLSKNPETNSLTFMEMTTVESHWQTNGRHDSKELCSVHLCCIQMLGMKSGTFLPPRSTFPRNDTRTRWVGSPVKDIWGGLNGWHFQDATVNVSTAERRHRSNNLEDVRLYTEVVTLSLALLTSFLFESSPLAAFRSFRKFSTVFFMFFNSPGCGVARLRSVR